jgi:hypothetical protein
MCRLLTATFGVAVFTAGVYVGGLWGLLLMIAGLVPAITGIANVSLIGEIRDERAHRLEQRRTAALRDGTSVASHR